MIIDDDNVSIAKLTNPYGGYEDATSIPTPAIKFNTKPYEQS